MRPAPGATTPPSAERNSISLFNIAYEDFAAWDGFAAGLEEHNAAAITFDQDVPELAEERNAVPEYGDRFREVFGGEISFTGNRFHALGPPWATPWRRTSGALPSPATGGTGAPSAPPRCAT